MSKLDEIAGMTGLPESALAEEAEVMVAEMRDTDNEGAFEGDREARREERKKDVIETKAEDYLSAKETTPPVVAETEEVVDENVEEDTEENIDEIVDPVKLRKMLKNTRRSRKKLVKKLGSLERSVALSQVTEEATVDNEIPVDEQAIYTELGIEDPDETLTARQHVALTRRLNELQASKMQQNTEATRKLSDFQQRVKESEELMRLEVDDYDEVTTKYASLLNPKSDDYDAGIALLVRTRKHPAKAFYDLLPKAKGKVNSVEDDSIEDDSEELAEGVDGRLLSALQKRELKQKTMTAGRTPQTGKSKRPKDRKLSETLGVFQQLQDMSEADVKKFLEKHGGDPYGA